MDVDYDYDADPFADLDYDDLVKWAAEHRDALIENGIDPDEILGDRSNQVSFGQFDEIKSVLEQCVPAVISQSAETLLLPVLMGISLQLFCRLSTTSNTYRHALSLVSGVLVISKLHSFTLAAFALLFALIFINFSAYVNNLQIAIALPITLLAFEWMFSDVWMHVRGSALILSCKLLSLFLNEENAQLLDTEDTETTFAILGYLFHPTTVIFGPWLPFGWYRSSIQAPRFSFVSLLCLVPAVISLVLSTCVFSIFPKVPGYNWYQAIVETYSFHCSHYYILFATQFIVSVSGMVPAGSFCDWRDIFLPFQMNEVCRSWNRPIHTFLKENVFAPLRKSNSKCVSILATFLFSAIMHGFNFPIFVTLITLGMASYGEFEFRRKVGKYYELPTILPTAHYDRWLHQNAKKRPKSCGVDKDRISTDDSEYSRIDCILWILSYPMRKFIALLQFIFPDLCAFTINSIFLLVNLTHLFYLGNLFSQPDMPFETAYLEMEKFDFISTKLAAFTLFIGYYC